MEAPDPGSCLSQRRSLLPRQPGERRPQAGLRHLQLRHRARPDAVKAARVRKHRGIAAPANVRDDRARHSRHRTVRGRLVAGQGLELRAELRVARAQAAQLHRLAFANASIIGCSSDRRVFSAAWLTIKRAETGMISSTA